MSLPSIKACVQNQICIIKEELTLADGTVLPSGSQVLIFPTTMASCILVASSGKALEETLSDMNTAHVGFETSLAGFQTQLTRSINRLSALEVWAANQGFVSTDSASEL